jgi:hypothetical protein
MFCLAAGFILAADPDPWTARDVVAPAALANEINSNGGQKGPLIIHVGFDVLYRAAHIAGTPYAGPASKPEGLAGLKRAVADRPRDRDIVLYCGLLPDGEVSEYPPRIYGFARDGIHSRQGVEHSRESQDGLDRQGLSCRSSLAIDQRRTTRIAKLLPLPPLY